MSVVYFMRGLPAAGKSTFARNLANSHNAIVLSKDNIRRWLCPTQAYEDCDLFFVERMRDAMMTQLLREHKDFVLDECFIEVADIMHAIGIINDIGAELVLVDLTFVPFDELYDRDASRASRVGFTALNGAWNRLEQNRHSFEADVVPLFDLVMTP